MDPHSEWRSDRFVEAVATIGRFLGSRLQNPEYHAAIAVDIPRWQLEADALPLSSVEREGSRRYRDFMDSNRSLIARSTLRILLGTVLGMEPECVGIDRTANGKPFVLSGPGFSVSHSGRLAVVALSGAAAIGVDVEELKRDEAIIPLLAETLSPREACYIGAHSNEMLLLRAWTRKEAVAKLSGEGLFSEFRAIEVLHEDGSHFHCAVRHQGRDVEVHGKDLDFGPGYLLALASTSLISEVTMHHVAVSNP